MQDLIKTHEANQDMNPDDSTLIHWGKFSLLGKFISTTMDCQTQCRQSTQWEFPQRQHIQALISKPFMMSDEVCCVPVGYRPMALMLFPASDAEI